MDIFPELLAIFNAMFLHLPVESLNTAELTGYAGVVSHMAVMDNGKRLIRRMSDLSYIK